MRNRPSLQALAWPQTRDLSCAPATSQPHTAFPVSARAAETRATNSRSQLREPASCPNAQLSQSTASSTKRPHSSRPSRSDGLQRPRHGERRDAPCRWNVRDVCTLPAHVAAASAACAAATRRKEQAARRNHSEIRRAEGVHPVGKGRRTPCHGGPKTPRAARLQRSDGSSASEGGSSAARLSKSER